MTLAPTIMRTVDSDWIKLGLAGMPTWADGPWHWLPRGVVCVYASVEPDLAGIPYGASVLPTKKSWRVDVPVLPVTPDRPAADQEAAIREAVGGALVLRDWARSIESEARGF